jgi:hypothetical protein
MLMIAKWTGNRMSNAGLLYQNYDNLADVMDDAGRRVGSLLLLNGKYRASTASQVMMGWFDTEAEALKAVARGNRGEFG